MRETPPVHGLPTDGGVPVADVVLYGSVAVGAVLGFSLLGSAALGAAVGLAVGALAAKAIEHRHA